MCALREQPPEDRSVAECVPGPRRSGARLMAALALAAILATVMVPYLAPTAQVLSERAAAACGAHAAWDLGPVMPACAIGDQHYEFSRAALIVAGAPPSTE